MNMRWYSALILLALAAAPSHAFTPPTQDIARLASSADQVVMGTLSVGDALPGQPRDIVIHVDQVLASRDGNAPRELAFRRPASVNTDLSIRPGAHGVFFLKRLSGAAWEPATDSLPALVTVAATADLATASVDERIVQALQDTLAADDAALNAAAGLPGRADPGLAEVTRRAARRALEGMPPGLALTAFERVAASSLQPARLAAIAGLVHLGDFSALPGLVGPMRDPSMPEREGLREIARELSSAAPVEARRVAALALVPSHDARIRESALEVLRDQATAEDAGLLRACLSDAERGVRFNAVQALARLQGAPQYGVAYYGANEAALLAQWREAGAAR